MIFSETRQQWEHAIEAEELGIPTQLSDLPPSIRARIEAAWEFADGVRDRHIAYSDRVKLVCRWLTDERIDARKAVEYLVDATIPLVEP